MLRLPKLGTIALDVSHFFAAGSAGANGESENQFFTFRDAVMRGILSAVVIAVLVILFLL
jgi:hypothetical protein